MAIPHAAPGQVIDARPLGETLRGAVTTTLIKTARLEVTRLVVPASKDILAHQVAGGITVQSLKGRISFTELASGQVLFLSGNKEHAVRGVEDAPLLLTILL